MSIHTTTTRRVTFNLDLFLTSLQDSVHGITDPSRIHDLVMSYRTFLSHVVREPLKEEIMSYIKSHEVYQDEEVRTFLKYPVPCQN